MAYRTHVTDPANIYHLDQKPHRNGWHYIFGKEADCLNGSISRVFLTGIPTKIPSSGWQQDTDFCCGSSSIAIALGRANDSEIHQWLIAKGYMTPAHGTTYQGIVAAVKNFGYSCAYDGLAHDGKKSGAFYDSIINHLKKGYKVILCMHGKAKGGTSDFYTKNGHYIVLDGIMLEQIDVDGVWSTETTLKAQEVFGTSPDGEVWNQPTSAKVRLPFCKTDSWKFSKYPSANGSALVKAIQKKINAPKINGVMDKATIKALQKFLGIKQIGIMGKNTIRHFQKWLNKNSK